MIGGGIRLRCSSRLTERGKMADGVSEIALRITVPGPCDHLLSRYVSRPKASWRTDTQGELRVGRLGVVTVGHD